jgi:hypothetical protein
MHRCLPLLKNRRKLVFLASLILTPKALTWHFLLDVIDNPNAE